MVSQDSYQHQLVVVVLEMEMGLVVCSEMEMEGGMEGGGIIPPIPPPTHCRLGMVEYGIESLGDEFQTYSLKVLEQIEEQGNQQNKTPGTTLIDVKLFIIKYLKTWSILDNTSHLNDAKSKNENF